MIVVKVNNLRNRDGMRSEDYIKQATGVPDEYGNPFSLIELVWKLPRNTEYAKTGGFEDTIIEKKDAGGLSISYRKQGSATWHKNLAGVYSARVAKTPHNMRVLAAMYADRMWDIRDKVVDAEVKAMAKSLYDSLTPELKKFNDERIKDMRRSPWEKADEHAGAPEDTRMEAKILDMDRQEHAAKARELEKREAELAEREAALMGKEIEAASEGLLSVGYTEDALNAMHISKVKNILRTEFDEHPPLTTKKTEYVQMVLQKQQEMRKSSSTQAEAITS